MRTTLTLEEDLVRRLRRLAFETGKPFKVVVNEVLRNGLDFVKRPSPKKYRLKPVSLGGPLPGVDLTKALRLAEELEDQAVRDKMHLRK